MLAVTWAEVVGVSVVDRMAAPLVALARVAVDIPPVAWRVDVIAGALAAHTGTCQPIARMKDRKDGSMWWLVIEPDSD